MSRLNQDPKMKINKNVDYADLLILGYENNNKLIPQLYLDYIYTERCDVYNYKRHTEIIIYTAYKCILRFNETQYDQMRLYVQQYIENETMMINIIDMIFDVKNWATITDIIAQAENIPLSVAIMLSDLYVGDLRKKFWSSKILGYITQEWIEKQGEVNLSSMNYFIDTKLDKRVMKYVSIRDMDMLIVDYKSPRWVLRWIAKRYDVEFWENYLETYEIKHSLLKYILYYHKIDTNILCIRQNKFSLGVHNIIKCRFLWAAEHHVKYPVAILKTVFMLVLCNKYINPKIPKPILYIIIQYMCLNYVY